MVRLKKISLPQVNELIKLSYKDDVDLCNKYHLEQLIPLSEEEASSITFAMIQEAAKIKKLDNYKILYNNTPVGYVTTFDKNFLYSYALNKNYRKKAILIDWWSEIKKELNNKFQTMIYSNNKRAVEFLLKNNMSIIGRENNVITFISN